MNTNGKFDLTNDDFLERASFYKENLDLDIVPFFKKSDNIKAIQGELARSVLTAVADKLDGGNPLAETLSKNTNPRDYKKIQEVIRENAVTLGNSDIQKICSICFTREQSYVYYNAREQEIVNLVQGLKERHDKFIKGEITPEEMAEFMIEISAISFGTEHLYATETRLMEGPAPFTDPASRAAEFLETLPQPILATIIVSVVLLGVVLTMMSIIRTVICLVFNDTNHDMYTEQWNERNSSEVYIKHGELTAFMDDENWEKSHVQIPKKTKYGNVFCSFFVTEKNFGIYGSESTIRFKFNGLKDTVALMTACPNIGDNRINVRLNEPRSCQDVHDELYNTGGIGGRVSGPELECSYHINSSGSIAYAIVRIKEHATNFVNFENEKEINSYNINVESKGKYNDEYRCRYLENGESIKIRADMDNSTDRSILVSINMRLDSSATISINGNTLENLVGQDQDFKEQSFVISNFFLPNDNNKNINFEIKRTGDGACLFVKQIDIQYEDEQSSWSGFPNKPEWMKGISDEKLLSDINIPGTHDSAAINSSGMHTPYACHSTTITQQLNNGIRLFDVRLKVKKNDFGEYYFMTCHGPLLSKLGINEYQTFESLMKEFKTFLNDHKSEVLVVSLKIDDWNGMEEDKNAVLNKLMRILSDYPLSGHYYENAKIGDVRGKIYLLNRITSDWNFGTPISWDEATEWQEACFGDKRKYKIYVQDKFKGLSLLDPEEEKFNLVVKAFNKKEDGIAILNYASACKLGIVGVYFTEKLVEYWLKDNAADRKSKLGWLFMDYEMEQVDTLKYGEISVVDIFIDSNFGYSRYCYKSELEEKYSEEL